MVMAWGEGTWPVSLRAELTVIRLATAGPSKGGHGESALVLKLEIRKAKVEDGNGKKCGMGNGTLNAQGFQGRAEESRHSQMLKMAAMISATTLNDIGIW
jgi:hypothetical protein